MRPLCTMTRVGELSFGRAVEAWLLSTAVVFVRAVVVVIEEGRGGGSGCLAGRFLEFTIKGLVSTPTLEVARENDDDA